MKTLLALFTLCLPAVLYGAVPARYYYEQANEPRFDEIQIGMPIAEVNKICGGRSYLPFETVRGGFAFAVDEKRSGMLALPWRIDLNQTVDFFTSKNRVLVVFYKEGKGAWIDAFRFCKGPVGESLTSEGCEREENAQQVARANAHSRHAACY